STEIPDDTQPPKSQLIFSKGCQFCDEFSSVGGQLQGDSDVILVVPENAIQHPDTVTIAGAVSVDLKTVHDKLGIDQDDVIVSPVIEYVTEREDFVFQKPVRVYLPHFLPSSFSPNDVSVYQFYKGEDGNIHTEKAVRVADEDDVENAEYDGSGGTFCILETDNILVFMSHFSGVFSCFKSWVLGPPQLHLRLYGEHIQRNTRDVDLDLLVSDKRLTIRDFIKIRNMTQQECDIHRFAWRLESTQDCPPEWFKARLECGFVDSTDTPFNFLRKEEPVSVDLKVNSGRVDRSGDTGPGGNTNIFLEQGHVTMTQVAAHGSGHTVGDVRTEDRHDKHTQDNSNTCVPEGCVASVTSGGSSSGVGTMEERRMEALRRVCTAPVPTLSAIAMMLGMDVKPDATLQQLVMAISKGVKDAEGRDHEETTLKVVESLTHPI
ncbi:hypothetical protein BaRGS_00033203, partial [Batillaria attramentaria]